MRLTVNVNRRKVLVLASWADYRLAGCIWETHYGFVDYTLPWCKSRVTLYRGNVQLILNQTVEIIINISHFRTIRLVPKSFVFSVRDQDRPSTASSLTSTT